MKRTYYIAFKPSPGFKWWNIATTKDYRHCLMFYQEWMDSELPMPPEAGQRRTVYVESCRGYIMIEPYLLSPNEIIDYLRRHEPKVTVVRITLDLADCLRYRGRGAITCVSMLKAIMGVGPFWIITPKQFLNYLIGLGAETVLDTHNHVSHEESECAPTAPIIKRL